MIPKSMPAAALPSFALPDEISRICLQLISRTSRAEASRSLEYAVQLISPASGPRQGR